MSVGIVIGTYGDIEKWEPLAKRAMQSAIDQTAPARVVWEHGTTLKDARNEGASRVGTDWLIFLDADDTLRPDYVEMSLAGTGDIRQPMTVTAGNPDEQPIFIPPKGSLRKGNWIVVGAMCRAEYFNQVGGFKNYPIYEDWALWLEMAGAGAEIGQAPGAIYEVTVMPDSRNQADRETAVHWFNKILRDIP